MLELLRRSVGPALALTMVAPAIAQSRPGPDPGEAVMANAPAEIDDRPSNRSPSPNSSAVGAALVERLVRHFDFDEPANPLPIPQFWVRIADKGFPEWNPIGFVPPRPEPGRSPPVDRHYRIQTQGGHTGIRLVGGVLSAIPMTDYLVGARVRTDGLERSRGRLIARFVDSRGEAIPDSEVKSPPMQTGGEWRPIQIHLAGRHPDAAWLQIDLVLEQESRWRGEEPGFEIHLDDVTGAVDFENLSVWRLPRIELTASETNIITAPDPVEINLRIDDLTRGRLQGRLQLFDHRGDLVDEDEIALLNWPGAERWRPNVDRFGWYRVVLDLFEDELHVARAGTDFAYLPHANGRRDGDGLRFTLDATTSESDRLEMLPRLATPLAADVIILPLTRRDVAHSIIEDPRNSIHTAVEALIRTQFQIGFAIDTLPMTLAEELSLNESEVFDAFCNPVITASWHWLRPYLIDYGQRVQRWRIASDDADLLHDRLDLDTDAARIIRRLAELVPHPELRLPWSAEYEPPRSNLSAARESRFVARLPVESPPSSTPLYVERWLESDRLWSLRIDPIDMNTFGASAMAADFVKRTVLAAEAGAPEIEIGAPWRLVGATRSQAMPTVLYPAVSALVDHLANRKAVGRINFGSNVVAIIFRDEIGDGCLVMWNDSSESHEVELSMLLGPGSATLHDMFGNASVLTPADGAHEFIVGREPIFLTNIDVRLAEFRAGFQVVPEFVEASASMHNHEIILHNPWPETVSGRLRIDEPNMWSFDRRYMEFEIPGSGELRIPLVFSYPLNEFAGQKTISVVVELNGDPPIRSRLEAPLRIGLRGVTLQPSYRLLPRSDGPADLVVTHELTNHSDSPMWLVTFAAAPGLRYQESSIASLQPAETAIRSFIFRGAGDRMRGRSLRIGLREMDDTGRLNLELPIE